MRGGGFGGSSGPPERSQQSGRWSVRAGRRGAVPGGLFRSGRRDAGGSPFGGVAGVLSMDAGGSDKAGGSEAAGAAVENPCRVCGKEIGGLSVQAHSRRGGRREAGGSPFGGEPGAVGNGPAGCPFGARIRKMFWSSSGRGRFRMRAGSRTFKNMLENNKQ